MAFGSFFKKIISGAKNLIGKIVPKVKKAVEAVSKFTPLINQAGELIGGNVGDVISTIGNGVSKLNDRINYKGGNVNALGANNGGVKRVVGANGAGIRRFDIPLLKE